MGGWKRGSSGGRGLKGLRFDRYEGGKWMSSSSDELSHMPVSMVSLES